MSKPQNVPYNLRIVIIHYNPYTWVFLDKRTVNVPYDEGIVIIHSRVPVDKITSFLVVFIAYQPTVLWSIHHVNALANGFFLIIGAKSYP